MSKNYGFARCSLGEDKGQDLNRQVRELKAAGAEEIITERIHGDARVKPQLDFLLEHIEPKISLLVTEVSRLSRSTQQLCEILNMIKEKHIRLVILKSVTIDCRNGDIDPMSMAFLQMAGVFSELELSMIRARVRSGMSNARAKGKQIGRKPTTKEDNQARAGMYPKTLQYLMGHSDISVTMNTYTHLGLEDAVDEMNRMQQLESARKEQAALEGKIDEVRISKKMFRVG